jgi:predicted lipoprotein with Yx(FWY)xxD motif
MRLSATLVLGMLCLASATAANASAPRPAAVIGSSVYRMWMDPQLVMWDGFELLKFSRDTRRSSVCIGKCSRVWRPVISDGRPRARQGSQIRSRLLGTIRRPDGRLQVTYYHRPLYYTRDRKLLHCSGRTRQFGGTFSLVNAAGYVPSGLCGPY